MSRWTHIVGALTIETYVEEKNIEEIVRNKLKEAPKITGSERDAQIIITAVNGYNTWINKDCEHCVFNNSKQLIDLEKGSFECEAPENYQCPEGKYQTEVIISIAGALRDRTFEQTKYEFSEFVNYITSLGWDVEEAAATIDDEIVGRFAFYNIDTKKWIELESSPIIT